MSGLRAYGAARSAASPQVIDRPTPNSTPIEDVTRAGPDAAGAAAPNQRPSWRWSRVGHHRRAARDCRFAARMPAPSAGEISYGRRTPVPGGAARAAVLSWLRDRCLPVAAAAPTAPEPQTEVYASALDLVGVFVAGAVSCSDDEVELLVRRKRRCGEAGGAVAHSVCRRGEVLAAGLARLVDVVGDLLRRRDVIGRRVPAQGIAGALPVDRAWDAGGRRFQAGEGRRRPVRARRARNAALGTDERQQCNRAQTPPRQALLARRACRGRTHADHRPPHLWVQPDCRSISRGSRGPASGARGTSSREVARPLRSACGARRRAAVVTSAAPDPSTE